MGLGLFAQTSSATAVASTGSTSGTPPAIYILDPMQRGKDIVNMVHTLLTSTTTKTASSQVAIQTTRNGLISNVVAIDPAPNFTVLIIQYRFPRKDLNLFIVVPIEQITEVIYSTTTITGSFSPTVTTGLLPVFEVDFTERADDIIDTFTKLTTTPKYHKIGISQVALQTTLSGPYYAPLQHGLISNVQSISLNGSPYGTLLFVSYRIFNSQSPDFFVVVPTESIYGINYLQFGP